MEPVLSSIVRKVLAATTGQQHERHRGLGVVHSVAGCCCWATSTTPSDLATSRAIVVHCIASPRLPAAGRRPHIHRINGGRERRRHFRLNANRFAKNSALIQMARRFVRERRVTPFTSMMESHAAPSPAAPKSDSEVGGEAAWSAA